MTYGEAEQLGVTVVVALFVSTLAVYGGVLLFQSFRRAFL